MSQQLPAAQHRMFAVLLTLTLTMGRVPTLRELCKATGVSSTNGVSDLLAKLVGRGLLIRGADREPTPKGWRYWSAILSERAGVPISAAEARLLTRVWCDLQEMEADVAVEGLTQLAAKLIRLPPATIAIP